MHRRKRLDSDDYSETEEHTQAQKKQKHKATRKSRKIPTTKASITILATDISPDHAGARNRLDKIDTETLGRIKKAIALANHEGTGEKEAKAALRMASKLMARHSVTQADILSQESDAEKLLHAGTSTVSVKSTKPLWENVIIRYQSWASTLSSAMTVFFDCQVYSTSFGNKMEYSFYGLAEHTVAAAYGFEMCYNLIVQWRLDKVDPGVHLGNAYCTGVAEGLFRLAKEEKKTEKRNAEIKEQQLLEAKRNEEREEDRKKLQRLRDPVKVETDKDIKSKGLPKIEKVEDEGSMLDRKVKIETEDEHHRFDLPRHGSSSFDYPFEAGSLSDDDDDNDSMMIEDDGLGAADFNDSDDDLDILEAQITTRSPTLMPPPPPPAPVIKEEEQSLWGSVNQLVTFRETSVAVGDDYLKTQGIKLSKSRKTPRFQCKDYEAVATFREGIKDARKIDVRGRRLQAAEED